MEQYTSKTRADYGSGITRPKIEDKDSFELKGQFLKELCDNTFSGSDHEDANEHIEKVLEIIDLFHISNITIDRVMLRAFHMSLTGSASHWLRNKPSGSIRTWKDLKIKFLRKYCPPVHIAKKMEEINNFQQEPDENLYQAWEQFKELLMKYPQCYLTKMHEVVLFYNGLDVPTRQILDSIGAIPSKTAADAEEEGKTLEEAYYTQFGVPFQGGGYRATAPGFYQRNNANPSYQEQRQSMEDTVVKFMIKADSYPIRRMRSSQYAVSTKQNRILMYETKQTTILFPSLLNGYYYEEKKGSYGPQFSESYSKDSHIDKSIPQKEKDPGRLGELAHTKLTVKLADRTVKYPKGITENVLVGLRERMELDLEARIMGETLMLNRSLDPFFEDYIELNDLNVPLELRRDQVDDLMPTIKEGEVIEEFRARNDAKFFRYPIDCDHDKKIRMDCAYNLKFSCMIVLEDMDVYRDEGIGDVIFGEPFLREAGINAKRFEGMITIHNGNEEVTYHMVSIWRIPVHGYDDLAAKKSTKLVKYQSSGILCVIVVMLGFRRIYNTHLCSYTQHGESTDQNIRGVSHSNSFKFSFFMFYLYNEDVV
ncbi:gag-pol polyprotein [Tanacetum coccineum]